MLTYRQGVVRHLLRAAFGLGRFFEDGNIADAAVEQVAQARLRRWMRASFSASSTVSERPRNDSRVSSPPSGRALRDQATIEVTERSRSVLLTARVPRDLIEDRRQ